MEKTTVYIYRNAREVILYVGITGRGHRRAEEHCSTKVWWPEVASASFIHVASREAALNLEALFIETLNPIGNIQHRDPTKTPRAMSHAEFAGELRADDYSDLLERKPKDPPAPRKPKIPPSWTVENVEDMLRALPDRKQRTRMWMALDRDMKRRVGCIQCWTPRDPSIRWDGASCPECFSADRAKSDVVLSD